MKFYKSESRDFKMATHRGIHQRNMPSLTRDISLGLRFCFIAPGTHIGKFTIYVCVINYIFGVLTLFV